GVRGGTHLVAPVAGRAAHRTRHRSSVDRVQLPVPGDALERVGAAVPERDTSAGYQVKWHASLLRCDKLPAFFGRPCPALLVALSGVLVSRQGGSKWDSAWLAPRLTAWSSSQLSTTSNLWTHTSRRSATAGALIVSCRQISSVQVSG